MTDLFAIKRIPPSKNIEIFPEQRSHLERVFQILENFYYYMDGTLPGGGKTHIASAVAEKLDLAMIVFAPATASMVWDAAIVEYGLKYVNLPTGPIITYDCLTAKNGYQPAHGLLTRIDTKDQTNPTFVPTKRLTELINSGILIVFDEFQKVVNKNHKALAAKAILGQFLSINPEKSRIAFLSGSILDKSEHAVNALRMLGFYTNPLLYRKRGPNVTLVGIQEILDKVSAIDPSGVRRFVEEHEFIPNPDESKEYVLMILSELLKPLFVSIMPIPISEGTLDIKNGYFKMSREEEQVYNNYLDDFSDILEYNEVTNTVNRRKENEASFLELLCSIQCCKKSITSRVASEILNSKMFDEQGEPLFPKVIIFCSYNEVIDHVSKTLAHYRPLVLRGQTSKFDRKLFIDRFNEPNSNYRLLVANIDVGGASVNLQDTTGRFPRFSFIMPTLKVRTLFQAANRTYRRGLKGKASVRIVYGKSGKRETEMMTAIVSKGRVLKNIHSEQGGKFPNEYEEEIEN
jgi:hypothetical protein